MMRDTISNDIYYLGIDHGNHLMKGANHIMGNGVEALETKPTFSANTLLYDGHFYKIGESRMNVKDNKLDDDAYYLLTLVLMAKEVDLCQYLGHKNPNKIMQHLTPHLLFVVASCN
jgi:plasmid segregation protein ParM